MSTGFVIWFSLCFAVGMVWLLRHRDLSRARRLDPVLRPDSHGPLGAEAPRLSVLLAAKDEEANIEACVRSLLEQDYPNLEIIAANDRSADRTGEILDRFAAERPDVLRVVHVDTLPEGWCGKHHAMHKAMALASGDWLCFVDADCRQTSRSSLSVAMQEALANKIDLLSVLPVLETKGFWERVIQPSCAAIMAIWFRPSRANDPRSKTAYANGAFMLMSRETYDAIGGHEYARGALNEDMLFARRVKEQGRRLFVVQNDGLYVTRMYASFGEAWRGWTRIYWGCFGSVRRLLVSAVILVIISFGPLISLLLGAAMWLRGGADAIEPWGWLTLASGAVVLTGATVIYRFNRLVRAVPWAWLTYPLGMSITLAMLVVATARGGLRPVTWRGTTYTGAPSEASAVSDACCGSVSASVPTGSASSPSAPAIITDGGTTNVGP